MAKKKPGKKGKKIYNRIKAVLALEQKTSKWLAKELEVNTSTVSKWCRNESQPTVETLFRIAATLEIGVRELLEPNEHD